MRLKIGRIFDQEGLTDNEKVFCWFMTKMMKRYGWEEIYTLDIFDYKILLHSNPIAHATPGSISKRIHSMFKMGAITDRKMHVELSKELKERCRRNFVYHGTIAVGTIEVEITDRKCIKIVTYLTGLLGYMPIWINAETEEFDTTGLTSTEIMRHGRLTDPFELQEILNALD